MEKSRHNNLTSISKQIVQAPKNANEPQPYIQDPKQRDGSHLIKRMNSYVEPSPPQNNLAQPKVGKNRAISVNLQEPKETPYQQAKQANPY